MTRAEFDARRYWQFRDDNTEGYSAQQLKCLNDYLFNLVSEYDVENDIIDSHVKNCQVDAEVALELHEARQDRSRP